MRKLLKEIHLWLSLPFGVIISVICISGALLVFETEVNECINPHLYKVNYNKGDAKLTPSELILKAKEQLHDTVEITGIEYYGSAKRSAMLSYAGGGRNNKISVNPYTGEVNGTTQRSKFFSTMFYTHRWLMDAPKARGEMTVGKFLVGSTTIVMIVILITGLVVWFPKLSTKKYGRAVNQRLKLSFKSWRAFWFTSHLSLGFYSTLLLLLICLTGLSWSFGWYRSAAYALVGAQQGQKAKTTIIENNKSNSTQVNSTEIAWDRAFEQLEERYTKYKSISLTKGKADVKKRPNSKNSFIRDSYKFDESGDLSEVVYYKDQSKYSKTRGWFYALHTGSWGGIFVKILYFLIVMTGGCLPISGYYLWIRRKFFR